MARTGPAVRIFVARGGHDRAIIVSARGHNRAAHARLARWTPSRARGMVWDVATEDDVRRICLDLPGVTERLSWGQPAWFARTLMARMWEDDVLTVKTEERDVLAGAEPETYFWTPHHDRSPMLVLVRLERVADDELAELLQESYRLANGRKH